MSRTVLFPFLVTLGVGLSACTDPEPTFVFDASNDAPREGGATTGALAVGVGAAGTSARIGDTP